MNLSEFLFRAVIIGCGATLILDLWALLLNRLFGFGLPNWAMVGRWMADLPAGHFVREDMGVAAPVSGERAIGWIFHYAVGILFAFVTLVIGGVAWAKSPSLPLPMSVGIITIGCGWFILQPAMGAGIAASRMPDALRIRTLNVVGHIVFGLGLWLTAQMIQGW